MTEVMNAPNENETNRLLETLFIPFCIRLEDTFSKPDDILCIPTKKIASPVKSVTKLVIISIIYTSCLNFSFCTNYTIRLSTFVVKYIYEYTIKGSKHGKYPL